MTNRLASGGMMCNPCLNIGTGNSVRVITYRFRKITPTGKTSAWYCGSIIPCHAQTRAQVSIYDKISVTCGLVLQVWGRLAEPALLKRWE